ncbi:universal stress protein [Brevibacterium oceani]|uniref:universal stress protein n=1 Tax=Brevibacterium oceani TaxID=358099 RepID=UPI001B332AE8|nr:universal stress protein [Brevibacterium oceani]
MTPQSDTGAQAQSEAQARPAAQTPPGARARIVVGLVPDQPAEVLETAATFAERFGAELILAHVDDSRYTVEVQPDGELVTMPIDPDLTTEDADELDADLLADISRTLEGRNVEWTTRMLAGGPMWELDRLAEAVDAAMIIIGVRKSGIKGSLHEFFNGSVAIQLAQNQHRPLVVVPLRDRDRRRKAYSGKDAEADRA